jgi:hypothetical protein
MYYVGIGGNRNTTTRLRRYVGQVGVRPLPQHDRSDAPAMLRPNIWTSITLTADGQHITVRRDGQMLFTLDDAAPTPAAGSACAPPSAICASAD